MKQKYSYILTALFCLLMTPSKLIAQQKLQVLTPPPPNVSALGKFGLTPVDYFTGVPRISVPLFTVMDGTLAFPISAQYHAGGIAVKEDASEIGLGWALNAAGTITSLTRGKPDFEPGGFWANHISIPDNPQVIEQTKTPTTSASNYYTLWTNDMTDFQGVYSGLLLPHNGVNTEYFYNFIVGYDGQAPDFASDLYTITLSDKSYKFVFDNNFNPVVLGDGTLKIELIANGEYPDWKVTDEKGIVYYFTQRQFNYSSNFYPASSGSVAHLNTWHLSKIVSPTYGEIDFKYLSSATTYVNPLPNISEIYLAGNVSPHTQQQTETVVANFSSYNQVDIDSITTSLGFIKFIYDDQRLDLQGARRLTSIEERDNANKLIKKVNFDNNAYFDAGSMSYNGIPEFQSVFSNLGGYTSDNHEKRLKLNSISELDVTNQNSIKKTSFTYNQQLNLPAKLSLAIDHWGFYNGASNSQLVPPCTLTVSLTPQSFTGATRGANPNTMQANVLTSIQYPTGGTSTYSYETNQQTSIVAETFYRDTTSNFAKNSGSNTVNSSAFIDINGNFTVSSGSAWIGKKLQILSYTSRVNPTGSGTMDLIIRQNGIIIKRIPSISVNSQTMVVDSSLVVSAGNYNIAYDNYSFPDIFTACQIERNVTIQKVSSYSEQVPVTTYWGGLRVSEIDDYDPVSQITNTKKYTYSGISQNAVPTYESSKGMDSYQIQSSGTPQNFTMFFYYRYGQSIYPFSDSQSAPYLGYGQVHVSDGENGNVNGLSEYNYDTSLSFDVKRFVVNAFNSPQITNPIMAAIPIIATGPRGNITGEKHYKLPNGNLVPVRSATYHYTLANSAFIWQMLFNQGLSLYTNTGFDNGQIFAIYAHQFEIPVLRNMLNSVEHDEYDAAGNLNLATYENYAYDNTNGHYQLIKKTTGDSKADTLNTYYKYPQDYGNLLPMSNLDIAAQGIQELQKTHVLQPVEIYSEKITTTATPLKTYLNGTVNIFYNNIPVVNQLFALQIAQPLLSFIPSSVSSNTFNKNAQYTSRVNFSKYDVSGRLLEQQLTNGPFYAYQWGYKGQYPVAQASNTKVNDIFYDSFEEGDGTLLDPKTGHYSFNGSYSKTLTGLDAGTYTLSYWKKTGSTWVWTINTNIPVTGSSYPLSISGQIDDIRFYPSGAQMITYTYDPLIGVTSATDTKGEITYYEYDGFQRLLNIKDKDGNIIKHTDYHYQGQ